MKIAKCKWCGEEPIVNQDNENYMIMQCVYIKCEVSPELSVSRNIFVDELIEAWNRMMKE